MATMIAKKPNGLNDKDLALLIIVTIILLVTCSCNPTKRAYKAIEKHPPITTKDSNRLAVRTIATFPPQPPKTIQGKTVTKTVVRENTQKVKALQSKIDSLIDEIDFTNELLSNSPKIDSLKKAIREQVLKDCKPKETIIDNSRVDSVFQDSPTTLAALHLSQTKLNNTTTELTKLQAKWNSLKFVSLRVLGLLIKEPLFWLILLVAIGILNFRTIVNKF